MDNNQAERMKQARLRALASADAMTDDEDAQLTAAAEADLDNPPLGAGTARPAVDVQPDLVHRMRGQRGPQKAPTKQLVSLRLDPDVLEHFRSTGEGWQSRMNEALRQAAGLDRVVS
jgi:uncharacterized protein (DUF4415 family)